MFGKTVPQFHWTVGVAGVVPLYVCRMGRFSAS
jgi:hypothetical protein